MQFGGAAVNLVKWGEDPSAAGQPVPARLHPDGQAPGGRVTYGGDHAGRRADRCDQRGPLGENALETGAFVVVAGLSGAQEGRIRLVVRVGHGMHHGRIS